MHSGQGESDEEGEGTSVERHLPYHAFVARRDPSHSGVPFTENFLKRLVLRPSLQVPDGASEEVHRFVRPKPLTDVFENYSRTFKRIFQVASARLFIIPCQPSGRGGLIFSKRKPTLSSVTESGLLALYALSGTSAAVMTCGDCYLRLLVPSEAAVGTTCFVVYIIADFRSDFHAGLWIPAQEYENQFEKHLSSYARLVSLQFPAEKTRISQRRFLETIEMANETLPDYANKAIDIETQESAISAEHRRQHQLMFNERISEAPACGYQTVMHRLANGIGETSLADHGVPLFPVVLSSSSEGCFDNLCRLDGRRAADVTEALDRCAYVVRTYHQCSAEIVRYLRTVEAEFTQQLRPKAQNIEPRLRSTSLSEVELTRYKLQNALESLVEGVVYRTVQPVVTGFTSNQELPLTCCNRPSCDERAVVRLRCGHGMCSDCRYMYHSAIECVSCR